MSDDGVDVDVASKVTRKIAEVSSLLDNRTTTEFYHFQKTGRAPKRVANLLDLSHQSGLAMASYAQA